MNNKTAQTDKLTKAPMRPKTEVQQTHLEAVGIEQQQMQQVIPADFSVLSS